MIAKIKYLYLLHFHRIRFLDTLCEHFTLLTKYVSLTDVLHEMHIHEEKR